MRKKNILGRDSDYGQAKTKPSHAKVDVEYAHQRTQPIDKRVLRLPLHLRTKHKLAVELPAAKEIRSQPADDPVLVSQAQKAQTHLDRIG